MQEFEIELIKKKKKNDNIVIVLRRITFNYFNLYDSNVTISRVIFSLL
jgi:hypothetical protein